MKVLHLCLCGPFTDGLSYQENELIAQHVSLGHDVTVIAATDTYGRDKRVVNACTGIYKLECGAKLIRLPYIFGIRGWLARKIRSHSGLMDCLESINPDRILFHGLTSWDLLSVAKYVQLHSHVKLFADCHEDFNNSARTWASRELLHTLFYRTIFLRSVAHIHEVLCITVESMDFAVGFYGSPREKTSLYPLGCTLESPDVVAKRRAFFRDRHGFLDSNIVITQTGKLDHTKCLASTLKVFCSNPSPDLRLVIAGIMTDDVKAECQPMIQSDPRIVDLGWQTTDELKTVLAGADCFLQPYGQTVTTQMAMGYGCVILAQDVPSHRWLLGGNVCLFSDLSEFPSVLNWVVTNHTKLDNIKKVNSNFAIANLDYRKLALRIVM
jgi:1,2-diacylglycerol 3-alpha-glucosyltransferase